jgi:hypothetical protein
MGAPGGLAQQRQTLWGWVVQQGFAGLAVPVVGLWVTDASSVGRQARQTIALLPPFLKI